MEDRNRGAAAPLSDIMGEKLNNGAPTHGPAQAGPNTKEVIGVGSDRFEKAIDMIATEFEKWLTSRTNKRAAKPQRPPMRPILTSQNVEVKALVAKGVNLLGTWVPYPELGGAFRVAQVQTLKEFPKVTAVTLKGTVYTTSWQKLVVARDVNVPIAIKDGIPVFTGKTAGHVVCDPEAIQKMAPGLLKEAIASAHDLELYGAQIQGLKALNVEGRTVRALMEAGLDMAAILKAIKTAGFKGRTLRVGKKVYVVVWTDQPAVVGKSINNKVRKAFKFLDRNKMKVSGLIGGVELTHEQLRKMVREKERVLRWERLLDQYTPTEWKKELGKVNTEVSLSEEDRLLQEIESLDLSDLTR